MHEPAHPGEILREDALEELGLSVTEFAEGLGVSRVALSRVLHGHAAVSPVLAVRLEAAGLSTARNWLALQNAHDLWKARHTDISEVKVLVGAEN